MIRKIKNLLIAILVVTAGNAFAANEGIVFDLNGFSSSDENGETVYSNEQNSSSSGHCDSFIYINGETANYNVLEFDTKWYECTSSNAKLAFQMIDNNGGTLCFEIYTNWNTGSQPVAIVRYPGVVGGNLARVELGEIAAENEWMHLKAVADDNTIAFYVNDVKIYGGANTYGRTLWRNSNNSYLYTYNTKSSYKNIVLSKNDVSEQPSDEEWVVNGGVTIDGEGSDAVYTVDNSYGVIAYNKDFSGLNSIECVANYQGSSSSNMEYVGLKVYSGADYYQFAIWPNTAAVGSNPVVLLQKNDTDPINRFYRGELTAAEFKKGNDIKMRVVAENDYFAFYLNDKMLVSSITLGYDFGEFTMTGAEVVVQGCPSVIKNVAVSHQPLDYSGYIDFEFDDARSISNMAVENGSLAWSDGAMVATISGNGMVVTSPEINVPKGHRYSAKLCVRNTIVLRLKNESDANSLTMSFVTREDMTYDDKKQMKLAIEPHSDYTTYFLNLSEVYDCGHWKTKASSEACNDYLAGFKLAVDGATSGTISIDAISFQREDRAVCYAAESLSCTADAENVTISGKVKPEYAGKAIRFMTVPMKNYNHLPSFTGNKIVATATPLADGTFTVSFPMKQENMTHLSSWFIGAVGTQNIPLAKVFKIGNYRDFIENKYAFSLPALEVDVTNAPFNAQGDAFTDDTKAIQDAIDYVAAQGGGKVVVPGSIGKFGRRYIVTGLRIKDNVELNIAEGAILWQSQRNSDYTNYKLYFGHENMGASIAWGLSALMHYPMIFIKDAKNVRVTGGGELRMSDIGSENIDGNGYGWDSNITVGCDNIVHMVPIGIYGSSNVEVSDITVKRCNNWHFYIRESSELFIANVDLAEVNCINGDGFDFSTAVHNVQLFRSSLYSNDDAVVLGVTTNDPRDDHSIWRKKITDDSKDRSLYNFEITGCNLFGGHGITFIPWASDFKDESKVEIRDIVVTDCVLGGTSTSVGVWADNPFYGKSNYFLGTYGSTDAVEDGDYSPMKNIVIVNNSYTDACSLYGTKPTNFISDCGLNSASTFQNGNFDKNVHKGKGFSDETEWVAGLSYWSYSLDKDGSVETVQVGTKQAVTVDTGESFTQADYAGVLKGSGELFQGLYLAKGTHTLSLKVKLEAGESRIFVRNAATDEFVINETLDCSSDFENKAFDISIASKGTYHIGVTHSGNADEAMYIDDCTITELVDDNKYEVGGDLVIYDFAEPTDAYEVVSPNPLGVTIENEHLVVSAGDEHKIMFPSVNPLKEFMVSVDINLNAGNSTNAGIYVLAAGAQPKQDIIDALNVHIEGTASNFAPKIFRFSSASGYGGNVKTGPSFSSNSGWVTLKVVVKDGYLYVFIDDDTVPCITFEIPDNSQGDVGLRSQMARSVFDNFTIKSPQYSKKGNVAVADVLSDSSIRGDKQIFDLQGRKIVNPCRTGIYIVDGKKVMLP